MSTQIVVALIAVGGVLVQVVATYAIGRQSVNDLRNNIERDIKIIRKLDPASPVTTELDVHVMANIDEMIKREERRSSTNDLIRTFGPLPAIALIVYGMAFWWHRGPDLAQDPFYLRMLFQVVYWSFVSVLLLLAARFIRQVIRYVYWGVRLRNAARRWRRARKRARASRLEFKRHLDELESNKASIVDEVGKEVWAEQYEPEIQRWRDELAANESEDESL